MRHYTTTDANINSAANRLDVAQHETPREVNVRMLKRSLEAMAAAGMAWTPGYKSLALRLQEMEQND